MVIVEYGTGMWAYTLRELSTHAYTMCDKIIKGQKKGKCFSLSALVWFEAESLYFPEFLAAEELYATIITEELQMQHKWYRDKIVSWLLQNFS